VGIVHALLGRAELKGPLRSLAIEYNESGDVHLQTEAWRLELVPEEFFELAEEIARAAAELRRMKGL
jgi:hypothetical protein